MAWHDPTGDSYTKEDEFASCIDAQWPYKKIFNREYYVPLTMYGNELLYRKVLKGSDGSPYLSPEIYDSKGMLIPDGEYIEYHKISPTVTFQQMLNFEQ